MKLNPDVFIVQPESWQSKFMRFVESVSVWKKKKYNWKHSSSLLILDFCFSFASLPVENVKENT